MQSEDSPWLAVIGRSLAYIALHKQELGAAGIGERAAFLEGLGVPRADVAAMLGANPASLKVMVNRIKRTGGRRRGRAKKEKG
jgi:hypothetical protein